MPYLKSYRSLFLFLAIFLLIFIVQGQDNSPQIDSTLNDSLLVDRDGDGRLDAGDTLRYTLEITNCGNAAAENVQFTGQADPNTQFLAESVQVGAAQPAATCPPQGANPNNNGNGNPVPANDAPEVRTHTPDNGDTEVALNSNITLRFNKRVDVTGDWFEIVCTISGTFNISSGNVTVSGGPINWTFDPNVDLQVGESCVVTIFAANVNDRDNNDPPDNMVADYSFTFSTETPPTVASTNPANGATAVPNTNDIVITFDEPVTVSAASFTLECPAGTPFAGGFAVSGSGTATVTINPTGNLPSGTTCQVVIIAANVSDVDANDPPDLLDGNGDNVEGDDYTFSFTTDVDAAPTVISITPANGSVSVPSNTTITITFSELVDISSAADFSIECPVGTPIGFTVTSPGALPASTTTVVITPAGLLPDATTCTVTVFTSVTDSDMDDPPNNMAAPFVSTFTTEAAPAVTTTNPANGATGIGTGSNIVIDFDEPVTVSTSSFTIECPAGGTSYTFTVAGSGTNSITLDPTTNLLANQTCTVTVLAAQVIDSDLIDPPDNMVADYVFSFDTIADTAPVASSPLDGATGVATASNIVINFNEPVDVTAGAFVVECPVGTPVAFTTIPALPTTNQTSITIDPTGVLPATSTCAVTVLAANVTDTDLDEPPDNMAADYSFTFDTIVDLAPIVDQPTIAPASTSTGANSASLNNPVSTTFTISIPFSEAVDAASGAFTLTCNAAPVVVTTSPALPTLGQTSIDVSPAAPIAEGANCVLTVVAANINDSDTDDPPNFMVTDFTLSFSSDTAPAETLTETEVGGVFQDVTGAGATNVDLDSDIQITFNEAVTVTFPANGLQCPAGNNIPVTVTTNNAATIVLNPDTNLPLNTLCVLNIPAANISDVDTADAPDNPLAAVNHSFTTVDDDAPTVTTNPAAGGSNIAVNSNITVTFNEAVTLTGAWFDLTCTVSGNRVSTGELTGTGITIIENTPDLVYTIDPTVDLAAGDICTITIDSANVVDNDVIDSPNELDGDASADIVDGDADDYQAIFSTQDMPPQVLNSTPANTDTVGAGQVVTINFTEAVNVAAGAFTFECPTGTPVIFNTSAALPAAGITTIDLTPTSPLPFGETCTVTIDSSLVVDTDPVDPPNFLDGDNSGDLIDDADNFVLSFTVDAEPTLLSSEIEIGGVLSPAAGAVNVDLDTNIVLTFSEPVNADLTSFDLECPAGSDIAFTVLGTGTATITIDPTPAFLAINTLCDFDIIAANISDVDTFDAPDTLAADINFSFTTVNDDFPAVTTAEVEVAGVFTALPLAGTYVDADTDLRITFSEAVTVTGNWAELDCTLTGVQDVAIGLVVTDADPVYTLNPATDLTAGEDCTLTVFAAQIDDDDAIDPPTNMVVDAVFTFTVLDTPPQVDTATSSPVNASIVPNNQVVTINFTEMVDIAAGAISFVCNATPVTFTPALPVNNVTTIALTPSVTLSDGAACTVTLESTLITDDDTADAPDELDGDASNDIVDGDADDFVLNFTVDLAPTVTSAEVEVSNVFTALPLGAGTYVDADTDLRITFSEAVTVTGTWAELDCTLSGIQDVTIGLVVTDADPVYTLNPATDLTAGEDCTLTIFAVQVADDDAIDPPDNLTADAVFTFTIQDVPPQVDTATSTPADGDIVPNTQLVTLNFTEIVDIAAGAISFECNATPVTFTPALPQADVSTITLTPSAALDNGAVCSVTLESTLITDDDTADAPDELDGDTSNDLVDGDADDFVLNFTVDLPPTVTSATVEVAGTPTTVPLGLGVMADLDTNIVINFSEAIDSTAGGITLECPAGTPIAFTPALPVTNVGSFTINPSADLPGDTLCTVTVVAANTSDTDTIDAPNQLDGNGDTVEGDDYSFTFTTQPAAIDDAYTVTPHLTYDSGAATLSVRDNDEPPTVTITGFGDTLGSANGTVPNGTNFVTAGGAGGRIIMNADGTFLFYPDAGDTAASGTVTFFYTVTGGDTAQVTLTFEAEELVWFVDNSPGTTVCTGTNVGTQACPSADLATVVAVDTTTDTIFIADGAYTCGIILEVNEKVIGDGSSSNLQTLSGVSPVAGSNFNPYSTFSGTDPVLTSSAADCITLATGNLIQGVTIGNTGNFAGIVGTNYGTVTILETTINGTGQILNLDTGTVNATFDSLSSSSSDNSFAGLRVANSTANFTSTGGTTVNGSAATVEAILLIQNTGTGFNLGATSVNKTTAARAVVLGNGIVQSAPVTFTSLAITNTGGTALEMNRQTGLVTVSSNTGAISATNGAAVNIINVSPNTTPLAMNLGALTANTSSVATTCLAGTSPAGFCASGATGTMIASSLTVTTGTNRYGIRINNSSAALTFATVNISGMVATSTETDTSPNDGYPDNTTTDGDGIFLSSNTGSFTVNGGSVSNTNSSGADNVDIRSSSNIVFSGVTLSSAGKSNFQAINMTGTGSFNNGSISGAAVATNTDGFYFRANTGTLTSFNIDNTNCTMPTSANAEDCFEFIASGTHTGLVDIGGGGDTGVWRSNTNVVEAYSQGTANLTLNMESIDASPISTGLSGMVLSSDDSSTLIFRVLNNNFTNIGNGMSGSLVDGVIRILPEGTSTTRGRFQGNTVDMVAGLQRQNVRIASLDSLATMELYINNNILDAQDIFNGIYFKTECNGCTAQSSGDIFMQNNVISGTGNASGIYLDILDEAGSSGLRFNISDNTINAAGSGFGIAVVLYDFARNVDVTASSNIITGGFAQFDALTTHANNNFCLNITGHNSDLINLGNFGGTFEVVNYPGIAAANPGSTIDDFGTTITNVGGCSTPSSSGLVSEDSMDERYASLPAAQDDENLMLSIVEEAFDFGTGSVHAQSNFNIPLGPINIGTIPPNSTVIVTFDVMVNAVIPAGTGSVSLQGIISGTNFGSILTDDPETPLDMDTTITPLDSLSAVQELPQTGEDAWWQTALVWALRLGLLSLVVVAVIATRRRFFRQI